MYCTIHVAVFQQEVAGKNRQREEKSYEKRKETDVLMMSDKNSNEKVSAERKGNSPEEKTAAGEK